MKLSFLAKHNMLNAAVTIALLMATTTVGSVIARDGDPDAGEGTSTFIMTDDEMKHWIANTDAKLTFIGDSVNPLASRSADVTTVAYCNRRINNFCGGDCSVYTGGATCFNAAGTQCLAATNNVGFCSRFGCRGTCNDLATCGVRLADSFCYTPGTRSIVVGNY